jgi:hypothetical protein
MRLRVLAFALLVGGATTAAAFASDGFQTSVKPYAVPVGDQYQVTPLISSGDTVPRTSDPSRQYQMIGIPDGLGARAARHGKVDLYMNHELGRTVSSEPNVGDPPNRGAFVSKWRLAADGSVLSGQRAYDTVYAGDTLVGPAADSSNPTQAFSRFCSAFLADERVGFDRPIYLTGEESSGAETFDGRGGQSVAIYDGELHTLPKLGRFSRENEVVMPKTGKDTVVFPLEDGPAGPESQLYMYVGHKQHHSSSVLGRNGLDNGSLYVLKLDGHTNEGDFTGGSAQGHWVKIPNADSMTDAELESAADAAGAFGFVRIEDGASSDRKSGRFYFVTTGDAPENVLGRAYQLDMSKSDPTKPVRLSVVFNADEVIASDEDIAISPDNVDTSKRYLMINEDGTASSRPVMGSMGRDGSVWRFDLKHGFDRERVAQLNPPGRDGVAVGPGVWETSGIIDVSSLFGDDTWIYDIQAHGPTAAPGPNTVEDGQLVLMSPAS